MAQCLFHTHLDDVGCGVGGLVDDGRLLQLWGAPVELTLEGWGSALEDTIWYLTQTRISWDGLFTIQFDFRLFCLRLAPQIVESLYALSFHIQLWFGRLIKNREQSVDKNYWPVLCNHYNILQLCISISLHVRNWHFEQWINAHYDRSGSTIIPWLVVFGQQQHRKWLELGGRSWAFSCLGYKTDLNLKIRSLFDLFTFERMITVQYSLILLDLGVGAYGRYNLVIVHCTVYTSFCYFIRSFSVIPIQLFCFLVK